MKSRESGESEQLTHPQEEHVQSAPQLQPLFPQPPKGLLVSEGMAGDNEDIGDVGRGRVSEEVLTHIERGRAGVLRGLLVFG